MIEATALGDLEGVRHGFFTRQGGTSIGLYASLNCGVGSNDDAARVATNRKIAMGRFGLPENRLVTADQVHSAHVAIVDNPWELSAAPRVDGMVTRVGGMALGILTADCAPVLLADVAANVIGAAHAGWRGALCGVLEAVVAVMVDLGARPGQIVAAVGPCIGQSSYEVGPEFRQAYIAAADSNDAFFIPSELAGYCQFDLSGYVEHRLVALGLGDVEAIPIDTCADGARFFSYRRSTLRKEADYGLNLSVVALAP
jgi:YfiH family protein